MQAIAQLTQRCILLSKGNVQFDGNTQQAVHLYLSSHQKDSEEPAYYQAPPDKTGNHVAWARIHTSEANGIHSWGRSITFEFALQVTHPHEYLSFAFQVLNELEQPICMFWLDSQTAYWYEEGLFIVRCNLPKFRLYTGSYKLKTRFDDTRAPYIVLESLTNICPFEVVTQDLEPPKAYGWRSNECTYLEDATWKTTKKS
jgi:lipopolysaccharide transport system ATP-binding protein